MNFRVCRLIGTALAILAATGAASARELSGRVVDAQTGAGIAGATVTLDGKASAADAAGRFHLAGIGDAVQARAPGYARAEVPAASLADPAAAIRLAPFLPKALYLSFYGIGSPPLREGALQVIRGGQANALVIDVKGDRGMVAFRSAVPLAAADGAQRIITIPDAKELLRKLHQEHVYAIARIVVLKDDPLAGARPDLAVKQQDGSIYRDREGLRWVDPTQPEVRDYDIAIAVEAAEAGFDEIQFDYLRFPDSPKIRFPAPNTQATRTKAIGDFVDAARRRLMPYNVFLAVDVFGYICWNLDDTHIGQQLEDLLPRVDYLSPMLYPSGFQFGIPGYRDPVAHAYQIVRRSLDQAAARTHASPRRFRPWLQAFKDYAFDRRVFDADEVRTQIKAADDFGSDGWMLWNPSNVYSGKGLEPQTAQACS